LVYQRRLSVGPDLSCYHTLPPTGEDTRKAIDSENELAEGAKTLESWRHHSRGTRLVTTMFTCRDLRISCASLVVFDRVFVVVWHARAGAEYLD